MTKTTVIQLDNPRWLSGGGALSVLDYCWSCAQRQKATCGDDCVIDGGWPVEADSPPQCCECGVPLAATMLDEASTEIDTVEQWQDYTDRLNDS